MLCISGNERANVYTYAPPYDNHEQLRRGIPQRRIDENIHSLVRRLTRQLIHSLTHPSSQYARTATVTAIINSHGGTHGTTPNKLKQKFNLSALHAFHNDEAELKTQFR